MEVKEYEKDLKIMFNDGQVCAMHFRIYRLNGDSYRQYRRGKNRCKSCGYKITNG